MASNDGVFTIWWADDPGAPNNTVETSDNYPIVQCTTYGLTVIQRDGSFQTWPWHVIHTVAFKAKEN